MKNITKIDTFLMNAWGWSFLYAFILVNDLVAYLVIGSIDLHFNIWNSNLISYILSFIVGYGITFLAMYTLGSRGLMKSKLYEVKDFKLATFEGIKFADAFSGFLICSLVALFIRIVWGVEISEDVVNSAGYYSYAIAGLSYVFGITTVINLFRKNF
ncbi:hypothetical protein JW962_04130 [Candidatus Dojkabacteria bacterium]|nr:hypothetical protein [Candidatus Dojkabacteria bacterium]